MKRKVIQLAGKTLLVSLPSKWAKRFGVVKGDEVEVEERERALLIATEKVLPTEKRELALELPERFIERMIGLEYKKGTDELLLTYEDPKLIRIVKRLIEPMMGFEIINQGEKYCVVKSITIPIDEEFDNILRRVFLVTVTMAKDILDAVKKKEHHRLEEIKTSELTNNKLTDFCKRFLNKKGYRDHKKTTYLYCIVWELERMGDELKHICTLLTQTKKMTLSRETIALLENAVKFFDTSYHLFYKFNAQEAAALSKTKNALLEQAAKLTRKREKEEVLLLHHIMNFVVSTYDITGQYYAIIL